MAVKEVGGTPGSTAPRRRRRAPAEARREILDAAAALLAEQPVRAVTVAAIMDRTTLSRKSFYGYFRDRAELIEALVRPLRSDADAALARWRAAGDPVAGGRAALTAAAHTYRRHGAILRAVFWSSGDDPEVSAARSALIDPVITVADAIIRAAPSELPDTYAIATALVTMNVHRLLALTPATPDDELEAIVDSLATIWQRTLYSWGD